MQNQTDIRLRLPLLLALVVLFSGCAAPGPGQPPVIQSTPSVNMPDEPTQQPPETQTPAVTPRTRTLSPQTSNAVNQLLSEAKQAIDAENYAQAAVRVERALRIAPENGFLWYNLALVRYYQRQFEQCVQLTRKASERFLTEQQRAKNNNWQLMAACYEALGRTDSAAWARSQLR